MWDWADTTVAEWTVAVIGVALMLGWEWLVAWAYGDLEGAQERPADMDRHVEAAPGEERAGAASLAIHSATAQGTNEATDDR